MVMCLAAKSIIGAQGAPAVIVQAMQDFKVIHISCLLEIPLVIAQAPLPDGIV